jgi:hypothetical protein
MTAGAIEALTIAVVQWGLVFVTLVWVAEVFYNRCKRAEREAMRERMIELGHNPEDHL